MNSKFIELGKVSDLCQHQFYTSFELQKSFNTVVDPNNGTLFWRFQHKITEFLIQESNIKEPQCMKVVLLERSMKFEVS